MREMLRTLACRRFSALSLSNAMFRPAFVMTAPILIGLRQANYGAHWGADYLSGTHMCCCEMEIMASVTSSS